MAREDILGGLSSALARGQSLKQAMMSFYNAGYVKEEIEEAARALSSGITQQPQQVVPQQPIQVQQSQQPIQQSPMKISQQTIQKISSYGIQTPQQIITQQPFLQKQLPVVQNVSSYEQPQKPKVKTAIFVLVFLLMLLFGALATVFFFKDEILSFFSG